VSAVFADVWVDAIRRAHADIPEEAAVLYARPDGSTARAGNLAIELPPPDFTEARRLTVTGTALDGTPVRDHYEPGSFPAELAPLVAALTRAQGECAWEL
jgi:hypothetical protein